MTTRVLLISHAATAATRRAAFPDDEPLAYADEPDPLPRFQRAVCGPELRCRETAKLLGVEATIEPRLRDCDYGRWRGRTLDELSVAEPSAVSSWLTDPASAPHGGESIMDILTRVGGWLDEMVSLTGRVVVMTHPAVIKAAVVHTIHGRPESFWRIDVAPLSRVGLSGRSGGWVLQSLG